MSSFKSSIITDLLDSKSVPYQVLLHEREAISVEDAAKQRGVKPEMMVKSILLRDMGGLYVLACIPGSAQVEPRKVRQQFNCRRMTCADATQVEQITGFQLGTVAPLALKSSIPVVFDKALASNKTINISSGTRMAGLMLSFEHLASLIDPIFADITRTT